MIRCYNESDSKSTGAVEQRSVMLVIILAALLLHCSSSVVHPPGSKALRQAQNLEIVKKIKKLGHNGDWLVTRGYKAGDKLVTGVTNAPISHVAVLDLDKEQVIEAESKGVHATNLLKFINKSHRVILIRPVWSVGEAGEEAMIKARKLVGKKYDFLGTVGLNTPGAFYCSELAMHVYKKYQKKNHLIPKIIEPGHIYLWGTILYDSRPRHWKSLNNWMTSK